MKWLVLCTVGLAASMASATIIGRALLQPLPYRLRAPARLWLSPAAGLAVMLLVSVAGGWLGPGFGVWWCAPIQVILTLAALLLDRSRRSLPRHLLLTCAFTVLAGWPMLVQIARFGAYNPFSDVFTYLVHAQWLQDHGFGDCVTPSGLHPAETQVLLFQKQGLRMGASFLFGWLQGVSGCAWSYLVYPVAMLLPFAAGALCIGGGAAHIARAGPAQGWGAGLAAALTFNGFAHGTNNGFLPQTYGLCFAAASLVLLGLWLDRIARDGTFRYREALPPAALLAASLHAYGELSPFLAVASMLGAAALMFSRRPVRILAVMGGLGSVAVAAAALVNLEFFRMRDALVSQSQNLVGWAVPWSPPQFFLHALGGLGGSGDGERLFLLRPDVTLLGLGCLAAFALAGVMVLFRDRSWRKLLPAAGCLAVLGAAFLYFRYAVASPWPEGTGQTWSQFKLANWASPFVILMVASAVLAACRANRQVRNLVGILILGLCALGAAWHWRKADSRTLLVRIATGRSQSPLDAYEAIARYVEQTVPQGRRLSLRFAPEQHKSRQMVAYFLSDRPMVSDWRDDNYIWPWLPESERARRSDPDDWIVGSDEALFSLQESFRAGKLLVVSPQSPWMLLTAAEGGFGREEDASGWWQWTGRELRFRFAVGRPRAADGPAFMFRCQILSNAERDLVVEVDGAQPVGVLEKVLQPAWLNMSSPPLRATADEITIRFVTSAPPRQAAGSDPRLVSFLVKNLRVGPAPKPVPDRF